MIEAVVEDQRLAFAPVADVLADADCHMLGGLRHDQAQMTTQNAVVRTAVWRNLLAGRENREECGRGAGNLLQQPRRLRAVPPVFAAVHRSEERRVGKEGVSRGSFRWWPY